MNFSSNNWKVVNNNASLVCREFSASVDLNKPEEGLAIQACETQTKSTTRIMGHSHLPIVQRKMVDQYIRGEDLVATYTTIDSGEDNLRFRDQVYWRYLNIENNGFGNGVELLASLQTDLLNLSPRVQFLSEFEAGEVFVVENIGDAIKLQPITESRIIEGADAAAFVFKSKQGWSYLQALHESDCNSCEQAKFDFSGDKIKVRVTLHFDHLEKGVIRRIRVRGAISDNLECSGKDLQNWFDGFATSELPLTV